MVDESNIQISSEENSMEREKENRHCNNNFSNNPNNIANQSIQIDSEMLEDPYM